MLREIQENHELSYSKYKELFSSTAATPLFYGLIKTQEGLPIRPIVSFFNSPSYKVA